MTTDRIAVIDLETTGLKPGWHHRVLEVGIVVISPNGNVHAEYETLVNPRRDVGPTWHHQISAGDVLRAPEFREVAGDVLEFLKSANVVAGHNISFDTGFLRNEFKRLDVHFPEVPSLCTCRLFGRSSLGACCEELGIVFDGMPHSAIADARATAQIVSILCSEDVAILDDWRLDNIAWPEVPALSTQCFRREHALEVQSEPPRFLQRIAGRVHHDVDIEPPNVLDYLALIDRVLEDRVIDETEEDALVDAAKSWNLSREQVELAHRQYIHKLAVVALEDGIVTDTERRDLRRVCRLLGQDDSTLDTVLESATAQLAAATECDRRTVKQTDLRGKHVYFTGTSCCRISGELISKAMAETIATREGLIPCCRVTKKTDLLVVSDPDTPSGNAEKARKYRIRIMHEPVFWRAIGVDVE